MRVDNLGGKISLDNFVTRKLQGGNRAVNNNLVKAVPRQQNLKSKVVPKCKIKPKYFRPIGKCVANVASMEDYMPKLYALGSIAKMPPSKS